MIIPINISERRGSKLNNKCIIIVEKINAKMKEVRMRAREEKRREREEKNAPSQK